MIKINLLPAYILERRQVRRLMQMFAALAVVLVLAVVGITFGLARETGKVQEETATQWAAGKATAERLKKDTETLQNDKKSRLDVFINFYDQVIAHNQKYIRVM